MRLSPVSMMTRRPSPCRRRIASGVLGLMGSATPRIPATVSPATRNITVWPSARSASARPASGPGSTPRSSSSGALPSATRRPSATPVTPRPVRERNSAKSRGATFRSAAPARIAAASGCSLPRSRPAAKRSASARRSASACDDTSMTHAPQPPATMSRMKACRSGASGVVRVASNARSPIRYVTVPIKPH